MKILINGNTITECFNIRYERDIFIKVNKEIEILKRDKYKYILVVFMLAIAIWINPSLCYADKITQVGDHILNKIQLYMGVVTTIMCSIELATELAKGGRGYFQIIFKYGTGYAALILAPTIFEIIRELF